MRVRLVGICVVLSALLGFSQQPPGTLPAIEIRAEQWDIRDWSAVRLGQLSIVHERAGDRLLANTLSISAAPTATAPPRSAVPSCEGNCFLISSFEEGSRNRLGGYYSAFFAAPSAARLALLAWDDSRRALTLDFTRAGAGFCGMWIHLFDFGQAPTDRIYLDAGSLAILTFWVRGQRGSERVLLKLSDADWERKEDALPIGELSAYLPSGKIENNWQRAIVPMQNLPPNLNRRQLAALIFEIVGAGEGRIAIKDLAFCERSQPLPALSAPSDPRKTSRGIEKALWVWNTAEILPDAAEQAALAGFCRHQGISHVYLQLPKEKQAGPAAEPVLFENQWKPFLALLAKNGVLPYALDGSRDYALPEWHERVLKTVDRVAAYNRSTGQGERFAGMHYDIEPYLLPGFHGPRQPQILAAYLELLAKMAARTRTSGMKFGVDIPFWFDARDELTGRNFQLEFRGKRKPASDHIIDLVDSVTIMDYRTSTFGANGIAALADGELAYATRAGKRVFVGLETTELPDEDLVNFRGKPFRNLPERAPAERTVVLQPAPAGARIWLVSAQHWESFSSQARAWKTDLRTFLCWPAERFLAIPASRLTFARLGAAKLQQTMLEAEEEFSRQPSFAGFALHDYIGFRSLVGPPPAGK